MSDSVRPHRQQPTRLPCPWDSPGTNTGVGCHFLLQCMKVKRDNEVAQSCPILSDPMDCSPPGSSIHGIFQARVLEWGAIAFSASLPRSSYLYIKSYKFLFLPPPNLVISLHLHHQCFFKSLNFSPEFQLVFRGVLVLALHSLSKAMAPHSSTLAWKILWTEEPGRLQSMGSLRIGHD